MFRYDEYGEGRGSASNSDQTGTMSRASYHSSDPDHYPDLLDIPNRSDGRDTTLKFKFLILQGVPKKCFHVCLTNFYNFFKENAFCFHQPH